MLLAPVLFLASTITVVSGADWCYQAACNRTCSGPDVWGAISQQCMSGAQSPINVVTRKTVTDKRLTPLQLIGYQETFHGRLINNGHNVQLDLPSSITIKGGNLSGEYKAIQLHLHWGKDGGPGSEHTIDGEKFPMEMHIVHIKEQYSSLSQAASDHSGVAVLGFFFQASGSANKKFDPLINALKRITRPTSSWTLRDVSLEMFTPPKENMSRYFRYDGSLTTPNCSEAVVWSLFESTIPLSRKQLSAFCRLHFSDGKPMVNTCRPVQPLNGRRVYYSGGRVAVGSAALFVISVLASMSTAG